LGKQLFAYIWQMFSFCPFFGNHLSLPMFGNHSVIFVTLGDHYLQPFDHLVIKSMFPAIMFMVV